MASYKNQNTNLDKAIARLELERDIKFDELKYQLVNTFDSVKPVNILKETLDDFNHAPQVKADFAKSALSIAGGYLSKRLLIGKSNSIFKKVVGYVVQYGLTKYISKKVNSND